MTLSHYFSNRVETNGVPSHLRSKKESGNQNEGKPSNRKFSLYFLVGIVIVCSFSKISFAQIASHSHSTSNNFQFFTGRCAFVTSRMCHFVLKQPLNAYETCMCVIFFVFSYNYWFGTRSGFLRLRVCISTSNTCAEISLRYNYFATISGNIEMT